MDKILYDKACTILDRTLDSLSPALYYHPQRLELPQQCVQERTVLLWFVKPVRY